MVLLQNTQWQRSAGPQPTKTHSSEKNNRYFHRFHLWIPYGLNDSERYTPGKLYAAMDMLVRGSKMVNGMANRKWWTTHFGGWMHTTAVEQTAPQEGFIIHYFLVCFNGQPLLTKDQKTGIVERFKAIASTGTIQFEPSSESPIQDPFEVGSEIVRLMLMPTRVYPESDVYRRMGRDFDAFCNTVAEDEGTASPAMLRLVRDLKKA